MATLHQPEGARATVTYKGKSLARELAEATGLWQPWDLCSLIVRHAQSHKRVQEARCNGHPLMSAPGVDPSLARKAQNEHESWIEKRDAQLERRIAEIAADLPGVEGVEFSGDPRGCTVKLQLANGRSNGLGGDGWGVPQDY